MRKEGVGITSSHIESAAFQHWRAMYGSFQAILSLMMMQTQQTTIKKLPQQHSVVHATDVVSVDTKRLNVTPNSTSMDKHWEPNKTPTIHSNKMSKKEMERAKVKPNSKEPVTTVLNMGTKRPIVERRKPTKRNEIANKKRELQLFLTKVLSFYCTLEWNMG